MAELATAWNGVEPDHVAEYLVLQTAVGAWPIDEFRLGAYMRKAAREAKRRTSIHSVGASSAWSFLPWP